LVQIKFKIAQKNNEKQVKNEQKDKKENKASS